MPQKQAAEPVETLTIEQIAGDMSGDELKFIRLSMSITKREFAAVFKNYTFSAVDYWEKQKQVKTAHALCLKSFISNEAWMQLRRQWKNYKGNRKNLLASVSQRNTSNLPTNVVTIPKLIPGKAYGRKL